MSMFFTADNHFLHENILKYCNRPFTNIDVMNKTMIERWNEVVKPEDEVIHLGDFSMSTKALNIVQILNGSVNLLCGNHDKAFDYLNKKKRSLSQRYKLYYDAGFKRVANGQEIMIIGNHTVILCHFPYFEDNAEYNLRFKEYRPKDNGGWLLHGHCHTAWLKRGRQINVGVDKHDFRPVPLEKIIELMNYDGDIP